MTLAKARRRHSPKPPKRKRPVGRPKVHWPMDPTVMQKIASGNTFYQPPLFLVQLMFGSLTAADEYVKRYKAACKKAGVKYDREVAMEKAAKLFRVDLQRLGNWLGRANRYGLKPSAKTP
jgi:hypothetical protein